MHELAKSLLLGFLFILVYCDVKVCFKGRNRRRMDENTISICSPDIVFVKLYEIALKAGGYSTV